MIRAEQQHDWLKNLFNQAEDDSVKNNSSWLYQTRGDAKHTVMNLPPLNRKQEAWRYNRIDKLFKKNFQLVADNIDFKKPDIHNCLLPNFDSYRLVFVNGCYAGQLSDTKQVPDKVTIESLHNAINLAPKQVSDWFRHSDRENNQLFSVLNTALLNDGAVIHIDDHIELDKPIEIIYLNTNFLNKFDSADNDGIMTQIRNIISLGVAAKVTLIERFIGIDKGQYFHNNFSDIVLAEGALLKHYRVQDESREAYHLSSLQISQQKNSHYYSTNLAFGGAWSKTNINVDFAEQDSECILNGLYVVGDQQLTDFHLDVRHSVPACTSREQFKGILYGKGRAVFDGHILVEKQAQRSDAQLINNNLLLTRDAEVDTRPQLEIYADDVKCGHGTSVGQIDPEQLFYMRSRGLSETTAYKLLCLGFAGEIIDSIDEKILSEVVSKKLVQTLDSKNQDEDPIRFLG